MSIRPYLGTNISLTSVDEIEYRGLLKEGETLLAVFDGVLLDDRRQRVGGFSLSDFVILTDQRLITWARGFFNDIVDGFPWKDVDVVEADAWDPFHGKVCIAFRPPQASARSRRIILKGGQQGADTSDDRAFTNTLDYMPAEDTPILARMIEWVGDQVTAGVKGGTLFSRFAEQFPVPVRNLFQSNPTVVEPEPEPEPEPKKEKKRRWWPFGRKKDTDEENLETADDLIHAYERRRYGETPPSGVISRAIVARGDVTPDPVANNASGLYEFSRGLRLALEAPRRLSQSINRATQVMSGTSELIGNLQDPTVRQNAIKGLRHAMEQQEREQGPLSPVGPVVRAVLRFGEDPNAQQQNASSRRIQVRPNLHDSSMGTLNPARRRAPAENEAAEAQVINHQRPAPPPPPVAETAPTANLDAGTEPAAAPAGPNIQVGYGIRRKIGLRQASSAQQSQQPQQPETPPHRNGDARMSPDTEASASEVASPPQSKRVPVRRMVVARSSEPSASPIKEQAENDSHQSSGSESSQNGTVPAED